MSSSGKTRCLGEGDQRAVVNFRVDCLDEVVTHLAEAGARIDSHQESHPYGKFACFWDSEGSRVELWSPARDNQLRSACEFS